MLNNNGHTLIPQVTKKGFSLIEMVVVMSILSILIAITMPILVENKFKSVELKIMEDISIIEYTLQELRLKNNGTLPIEGLFELNLSYINDCVDKKRVYDIRGLVEFELENKGNFYNIAGIDVIRRIKTDFVGEFIANENGTVYYISTRAIRKMDRVNH